MFFKGYDQLKKITADRLLAKLAREDKEFLPAAISIIETPPSPIRIIFIWTICLLATVVLLWGFFGHIDIIAIAQGKVQPQGRVKTIQPVETGRVVAIRVENGQRVKKGDVLIELDPAEAVADESASRSAYYSFLGERIRRKYALSLVAEQLFFNDTHIEWSNEIPEIVRKREDRVFKADLQQLVSSVQSINAQLAQKMSEEKRLETTIISQQALVETLQQRVDMRKGLFARGSTTKAALIDAMESLQTQLTTLTTQKGQLTETKAAEEVLKKERSKAIDQFTAENEQKLNEAERQIDELEQRTVKAHVKTERMILVSPIDGRVSGLSITTRNQVVTTGEELMRIVPDDVSLEIECYAPNKDIGFIRVGQPVVIKIEAFPFTRFGTLDGVVRKIAYDAIPEPDAQSIEGNPTKSPRTNTMAGAQRVQNLVFPVLVGSERNSMRVDGIDIPLTPGMAVTVEIKTGKRRILEYLFSPLVETTSRAMKER